MADVELSQVSCATPECGVIIFLPSAIVRRRKEDHESFYCPNGHSQWFPGKTEEQKLREQLQIKERTISTLEKDLKEAKKPKKRGRPRKK